MKIFIAGVKGQLGYEIYHLLKDKETVIGVDIEDLDITDAFSVHRIIATEKPDVVINCAAYTNVDGCEERLDLAFKVNAVGAQNLASACLENNSKIVHISTDFVFDGKKQEPYIEFDEVNPLSVYGKSKYCGEKLVREICPRHFIVRTAWLYGINGNNFVKTVLRLAKEKDKLTIVNDQHGTPTYTKDLAVSIYNLIQTTNYGIYHISNRGECTWYDFTKKIFELAGINNVIVHPITTEELGRPAPRPKYSVLRNFMLECTIGDSMRDWEEALIDYMEELRSNGLI